MGLRGASVLLFEWRVVFIIGSVGKMGIYSIGL